MEKKAKEERDELRLKRCKMSTQETEEEENNLLRNIRSKVE